MTALAVARRRLPIVHLGLVGAALLLVVAGFASGVLPAVRWQPFLLVSTWTFLGQGLLVTLTIGGVSLVASLLIGIPLGMARATLRGPAGWIIRGWIELVRATPILAILIIVFLGLPRLGVRLEVTEAVLNHVSGTRGGIVGVYQRHHFADEKRNALDLWASEVTRIVMTESLGSAIHTRRSN